MGDCHYLYGNVMTWKRMRFLQEFMDFLGLGERLLLEWISSAEANRFVQVATSFTESIKELGPSPLAVFNRKIKAIVPGSSPGTCLADVARLGREVGQGKRQAARFSSAAVAC